MIAVVVPWRPDGGQRDSVWAWCRRFWTHRWGFQVTECDSGEEPFNRGASINQGVASVQQDPADVLVIADADTVVSALSGALAAAARGHWCIAHAEGSYCSLSAAATERLLEIEVDWVPDPSALGVTDPDRCTSDSGVIAMPRLAFDRVGGFPEGFVGWGGEDRAFAVVMDKLWEPHQRPAHGFALHLWHPRGPQFKSPDWPANAVLLERYREWALGTPGFTRPEDDLNYLADMAFGPLPDGGEHG